MTDLPPEPHRTHAERLTIKGHHTTTGDWCTLVVVRDPDGSWSLHLDAAGVRLAAADMVALAEAVLSRADPAN